MPASAAKGLAHPFAKTLKPFATASGRTGRLYSLPALAKMFSPAPSLTKPAGSSSSASS